MIRTLLAASAVLALASGVAARAQPLAAPIDTQRLSEHIRILASDAFEGRGPGTAGEVKAVAYITDQFKALGLQPAGDGGGWTQAVTLNRFTVRGEPAVSVTVGGRTTPLPSGEAVVVETRRPGVSDVEIANAQIVFVGYGVSAPERDWDDYKGVDLHGKIALVLVNDPDFATPEPGRFDGVAMTYYGRWTYKYEELARRGALGVLIVHETPAAGYPWYVVRSSWSVPQFDIPRDPAERTLMEGWITRGAAADLLGQAGLDYDALKLAAQKPYFHPVTLKGAALSARFQVDVERVVSHNVLAKRTGSARPGEVVLYGAHWDHLGIGGADATGDKIYNGALDNASGIGGLLELARLYASGPAPQRTVMFAAWTAEEKGLLGSEYYATHPEVPLARTVANLNMDGLAIYGRSRDVVVIGAGKSGLEEDLKRAAAADGLVVTGETNPQAGGYFRSDHFSLAKAGVPALSFHLGPDLIAGGRERGLKLAAEFTAQHYHQPSDEWRADWDLSGAKQELQLQYAVGRELADSNEWPVWRSGAEFKPARDRTADQRPRTGG